jgi:hemerythrin-like domain-containing protein
MSNEIAPILAELRQDHRNMAKLLTLLEEQTEDIFDEGDGELPLMIDIMHYMTVYPDTVHHPKEDQLYAELRAARPDLSQGMARVTEEHHAIGERGLKLCQKLEMAESGNAVRRKEIVADALRYIESLRAHMNWEESDLFRRLDKMLADGHGVLETATFVNRHDPLFGAAVEERFRALHKAVDSNTD